MSNILNKVKDALTGEHHHDKAKTGEDSATSVAHGSSISATNPGVLHSTKPGIHGLRDSGNATSMASEGDDSRLTGTTWGAHAGKSVAPGGEHESVAHGASISATNPGILDSTKPGIHGLRDSGTGITPGFEETERRGSELHHVGEVPGAGGATERTGSGVAIPAEDAQEPATGVSTTITAGSANNKPSTGHTGRTHPVEGSGVAVPAESAQEPATGLSTSATAAESNNEPGTGYAGNTDPVQGRGAAAPAEGAQELATGISTSTTAAENTDEAGTGYTGETHPVQGSEEDDYTAGSGLVPEAGAATEETGRGEDNRAAGSGLVPEAGGAKGQTGSGEDDHAAGIGLVPEAGAATEQTSSSISAPAEGAQAPGTGVSTKTTAGGNNSGPVTGTPGNTYLNYTGGTGLLATVRRD